MYVCKFRNSRRQERFALPAKSSWLCENAPRDMILSRFAGDRMKRFVEGRSAGSRRFFPIAWMIGSTRTIRFAWFDVFVDERNLGELGFGGVDPKATGRPSIIRRPS